MMKSFIEIKNLRKSFGERKPFGISDVLLKAIDDVSLNIEKGKNPSEMGILCEKGGMGGLY